MRTCECGCGQSVREGKDRSGRIQRFVRGHSSRLGVLGGKRRTCKRCGKSFERTARTQRRDYCSEECRFPPVFCGCGCGERISNESLYKNQFTRFLPGHHWRGRRHTEEERVKIGKAISGDKNGRWNGGTASLPYTYEFIKHLRKKIRKEYRNECALCGRETGGKAGHVHHIDYDRDNNDESNLILLCSRCHGRTHVDRKAWRAVLARLRKEVRHDHSDIEGHESDSAD